MMPSKLDLAGVTSAWNAAGERPIHPLDPDSPEFWALGALQAAQVSSYAPLGGKVMDFGAGNGRLTIPLMKQGYDVTAVDASSNMLTALGQRVMAQLGGDWKQWPGLLTTILSDGIRLSGTHSFDGDVARDFFAGRFDVVISRAVLIHHSYTDVEILVTELVRCLKPGGHLIADWPTAATPHERANWTDVTTWSESERAAVAARAGLTPVDVVGSPGHPGAPVWRKIMEPGELLAGSSGQSDVTRLG